MLNKLENPTQLNTNVTDLFNLMKNANNLLEITSLRD